MQSKDGQVALQKIVTLINNPPTDIVDQAKDLMEDLDTETLLELRGSLIAMRDFYDQVHAGNVYGKA